MEKELLQKLKFTIELKEKIDSEIKAKRESFEDTIKAEKIIQENYEIEISALKSSISELAIKYFEDTGNKTYIGGVKIQEVKKLVYDDKIAENWAAEKKMFQLFDKKGFEKAAANLNLEFVKEDKILRATYPSKIDI